MRQAHLVDCRQQVGVGRCMAQQEVVQEPVAVAGHQDAVHHNIAALREASHGRIDSDHHSGI